MIKIKKQSLAGALFLAGIILALVFTTCGGDETTKKYTVTKGSYTNGNFSITPTSAAEGATITLKPTADEGYQFDSWNCTPSSVNPVETSAGTYTFTMPAENVTVSAVFTAVPTVKTLTVVGGTGKRPAGHDSMTNNGDDNWDGTRHITVTVTMANGDITNVVIGHPIGMPKFENAGTNASFRTDANSLAAAIKTAKNADADFTPTGTYTGAVEEAWDKHEAAIREAVKDAVSALNAGKPNRILAGGGTSPWTANGAPLAGTATVTGSGFKSGGIEPDDSNHPTDMTVTVTVANGHITVVTVADGDDVEGYYVGSDDDYSISEGLTEKWPDAMIDDNNYKAVDTITSASPQAQPWRYVSLMTMRRLVEMAFNKIVNEY